MTDLRVALFDVFDLVLLGSVDQGVGGLHYIPLLSVTVFWSAVMAYLGRIPGCSMAWLGLFFG